MVQISKRSREALVAPRRRSRFIIICFAVLSLSLCIILGRRLWFTTSNRPDIEYEYSLTKHRKITDVDSDALIGCKSAILGERSRSRIAVAVLAANRPDYLKKVLDSLEQQTVDYFDVFLFVDKIPNDEENQRVLALAKGFNHGGGIHTPNENFGIARMTIWAMEVMFSEQLKDEHSNETEEATTINDYKYDRVLLLEDDHLIAYNYVEAIGMLLTAAEMMEDVAVVNGNMIDTPSNGTKRGSMEMIRDDESCLFQVAPLNSMTHLNSHNVWAWATTRRKWDQIYAPLKKAMQRTQLDRVNPYKKRNRKLIAKVMDEICPGSGYSQWKGQDWLRACVFYSKGMVNKMQPTRRLMSYIGQDGLHMKKEVFARSGFDPVGPNELTRRTSLERYPEEICSKTCELERTEKIMDDNH